ncbi:tumor suppressor candidate 2-like [Balaenoptera musculus]|uniref:Tumor suppressor candidate 2-like n=1 Tax=Balaenoptera musculus TaxID=9771 RepID=A0A8B8VM22_BALMU|nr:tumor suppressor candidate 2-like [Balaenoptera musculus]
MGAGAPKARSLRPFASPVGGGGPEAAVAEQALPPAPTPPPFGVTRRRGSMFYAEDGDLAHEFYEDTVVTKNGQKRAKRRRAHENLSLQGIRSWIPPRIHVDFPAILYEV